MLAQPEVYRMISPRCSVHHFTGIQQKPLQNKSTVKIVVIARVATSRGENYNKSMLINKTLDLKKPKQLF